MSSLLILAVIALLLPAVFDLVARRGADAGHVEVSEEQLSLVVSGVLLLLYLGNLAYTLVTHRDVFATGEARAGGGRRGRCGSAWPCWLQPRWRPLGKASWCPPH